LQQGIDALKSSGLTSLPKLTKRICCVLRCLELLAAVADYIDLQPVDNWID
jgi:hypothetical protein